MFDLSTSTSLHGLKGDADGDAGEDGVTGLEAMAWDAEYVESVDVSVTVCEMTVGCEAELRISDDRGTQVDIAQPDLLKDATEFGKDDADTCAPSVTT